MFGLLLPWLAERPWPLRPWAAAFAAVALAFPPALRPLSALWLKIGHVLGWINTRISSEWYILSSFYRRAFRCARCTRTPLHREFDVSAASYQVPSKAAPNQQMEKPF